MSTELSTQELLLYLRKKKGPIPVQMWGSTKANLSSLGPRIEHSDWRWVDYSIAMYGPIVTLMFGRRYWHIILPVFENDYENTKWRLPEDEQDN